MMADETTQTEAPAEAPVEAAAAPAEDQRGPRRERGEAETPAALHHLGDAVDADQLVDELAVAAVAVSVGGFPCHALSP